MGLSINRRMYNGEEYHCDPSMDSRLTKREAQRKANHWRARGYNARIARFEDGWAVYKSVKYSKR
jgi:hypothetical protein